MSLLMWLCAGVVWAQDGEGFDAHGLHLASNASDVRAGLLLQRPALMSSGDAGFTAAFEFAKAPLVAEYPSGERVAVVDNVLALNTTGSVVAHPRLRVDVAAPIYLVADGTNGGGAALGDVRLGLLGVLAPTSPGRLGVGLVPYLDLPSGPQERFLGQGSVAGGVSAVSSAEISALTLTGSLGARFTPNLDAGNLNGSDALAVGLGMGWLASQTLGITGEVRGHVPFVASDMAGTQAPWEGLLSTRWHHSSGGHLIGGVATALSPGVGAAAFRLFVGGGIGARPVDEQTPRRPVDTDGDGITDDVDGCVDDPEVVNGVKDDDGCPDAPPNLKVVATLDDQPLEGVSVVLEGAGESEEVQTPYAREVPPDTTWKASATLGDCLAGESLVSVRDEDGALSVPLSRLGGATLRVVALDPNGTPLLSANVAIESAGPGCGALDTPELGADGATSVEVGVGEHTVTVTAEGYQAHSETFTLDGGKTHEVFALLMPASE